MLEFAFEPKDVRTALRNANEWSPPPPPAKSKPIPGQLQILRVSEVIDVGDK